MFFRTPSQVSLKTRITLVTLAVFLLSIWTLTYLASRMLREDMVRQLGNQQRSTVTLLAAQVEQELSTRMGALKGFASTIGREALGNRAALQAYLEHNEAIPLLFNGGAYITSSEGTATASIPHAAGRVGLNFIEQSHVASALKEGEATVGSPRIGTALKRPVFGIATPILDPQGRIVGALVGVTDLSKPNFLNAIVTNHYDKTGGYLVVSSMRERLVVTSSDSRRIMQPYPERGVIPAIDRFLDGIEGSSVFINPVGVEVLGSIKTVPEAGWFVGEALPTQEAFSPIRDMQRRLVLATALMTLLVGGFVWWLTASLLKRQFSPMIAAADMITERSASNDPIQPLPILSQDEIGDLVARFNHLLDILAKREASIRESAKTFRKLFDDSSDPILLIDHSRVFVECNQAALDLLKMRREDFLHRPPVMISPEFQPNGRRSAEAAQDMMDQAYAKGLHRFDWTCVNAEGGEFVVEVSLMPIDVKGQTMLHTTWRDITERQRAAEALRTSEGRFRTLFEQAAVGVAEIDTLSGRFLTVNRKYCDIVGYSEAEMLTLDFPSITHPEDLAADLAHMEKLKSGQIRDFDIEKRYFRKDGHIVWVELTVSPMWAPGKPPDKHIAIVQDITRRKEVERQLERLAHTDELTGLANRRHFLEQAQLELSRSIRYGHPLSMLMIDTDHFKGINDLHGHAIGDITLKKLAEIFRNTLRTADLAGRIGGEEFAVLLPETELGMAVDVAERLREAVAAAKVPRAMGVPLQFTVSIGVSSLTSKDDNLDLLIRQADEGLYLAKNAGRNRVCVSSAVAGPDRQ